MTPRVRRGAPPAAALAAALVLSACGGVPTHSAVRVERVVTAAPAQDAAVTVGEPGPQPGASPLDIVRGFLRAQTSDADDYAVSREFLAPGATWLTTGAVRAAAYDVEAPPAVVQTALRATTGRPTPGHATTGSATTGSATIGRATAGRAITGSATAGRATTGSATTGSATTGRAAGGSTAGTAAGSPTPRVTAPPAATASVALAVTTTAALDGRGHLLPGGVVRQTYALQRLAGEWRLTAVPPGLLLTTAAFAAQYHRERLWWVSADAHNLVPDPVYLRGSAGALPTTVVRALLAGPPPRLAGAVRSAVPPGTALQGSVVTAGGQLRVDLSAAAAAAPAADQSLLVAQLAASLADSTALAGVSATGLRVTVDGQPLQLSGSALAAADAGSGAVPLGVPSSLDPDARAAGAVLARGGSLQRLTGPAVPLAGRGAILAVALSADGQAALALRATPGSVAALVPTELGPPGPVTVDGPHGAVLPPGRWASVSADSRGRVLVAGPAGLVLVSGLGGAQPTVTVVHDGASGGRPVWGAALSPDGVHVLLVVGPAPAGRPAAAALLAAVLTAGDSPALVAAQAVPLSGLSPVSATFASADRALVLSATPAALTALDGAGVVVAGTDAAAAAAGSVLPGVPVGVAAAAGQPVLLVTGGRTQRVWRHGAGGWTVVGVGTAVAYSG